MSAISNVAAPSQPVPLTPDTSSAPRAGGIGTAFKDVLDTINPFEHIPVVSSLYRAATGSSISTGAKLAGDTLYGLALGGGLAGMAVSAGSSLADTAVQATSGANISQHAIHALTGMASSAPQGTPLVPNSGAHLPISSGDVNTAPSGNVSTPVFFPMDKHPAYTTAQYHRAALLDTVNSKLTHMG